MYKILIVEDELPARKKLKRFLNQAEISHIIVDELETIDQVKFFLTNKHQIDLIFSDIELLDGNVFEVYKDLDIKVPIIFATAYNEFLMNAFETNGIEYLLKPYSFDRFMRAWKKYSVLNSQSINDFSQILSSLNSMILSGKDTYKTQLTIKTSKDIYFLKTEDIVYMFADGGLVQAIDKNNKAHILSQPTLKEIEAELDPNDFFRINRSETVHKKFIDRLERYNKNVLTVYLNSGRVSLKTSQNKTAEFNRWLDI